MKLVLVLNATILVLMLQWLFVCIQVKKVSTRQNHQATVPKKFSEVLGGETNRRAIKVERILLVHVGKTGGESLRSLLDIDCQVKRDNAWCGAAQRTALSRLTVGILHWKRWQPSNVIVDDNILPASQKGKTAWLFTVRNPLSRFQSWFRYVNPLNCPSEAIDAFESIQSQRQRAKTRTELSKLSQLPTLSLQCRNLQAMDEEPTGWHAKFFQQCFPSIVHLAHHLRSENGGGNDSIKQPDACSEMARQVLHQGKGPSDVVGHVGRKGNYSSYFRRTIGRKGGSERLVFAIRMEHLWSDVRSVEGLLPGGIPADIPSTVKISHGSEAYTDEKLTQTDDILAICCVLRDEWWYYAQIIETSINLSSKEKSHTVKESLSSCGVSSLSALAKLCDWEKGFTKK